MLLGSFLYEMLAGQLPFAADNVGALAERQLQGPRPLRKIRSDVPREVDAIVLQLLAEDPQLRFSDGAVLARALVEALPSDSSRSSRPITPPPGMGGKSNFVSESIKRPEPVATTSFWPEFGSVLWRTTRWILRRIVTASIILALLLWHC